MRRRKLRKKRKFLLKPLKKKRRLRSPRLKYNYRVSLHKLSLTSLLFLAFIALYKLGIRRTMGDSWRCFKNCISTSFSQRLTLICHLMANSCLTCSIIKGTCRSKLNSHILKSAMLSFKRCYSQNCLIIAVSIYL